MSHLAKVVLWVLAKWNLHKTLERLCRDFQVYTKNGIIQSVEYETLTKSDEGLLRSQKTDTRYAEAFMSGRVSSRVFLSELPLDVGGGRFKEPGAFGSQPP